MRKDLRDRTEKLFAAFATEMAKNPAVGAEINALLKTQMDAFKDANKLAYVAAVEARKAERQAKRDERLALITEARAERDAAKAKFTAALSIKVNGKVSARRAKKNAQPELFTVEEVNPVDGNGELADLPEIV